MLDYKLCYIDGSNRMAYFTTQELSKQWGDDWNDAPYQFNAGPPYEPGMYYYSDGRKEKNEKDWNEDGTPKWEIYTLMFYVPWATFPCDFGNNGYSVQQINAGVVAWVAGSDAQGVPIAISAGCSVQEFQDKIWKMRGKIYLEYNPISDAGYG